MPELSDNTLEEVLRMLRLLVTCLAPGHELRPECEDLIERLVLEGWQ